MVRLFKAFISASVFCIGIYVLVYEFQAYTTLLKLTREKIREDVIYQEYNITDRETISYAELIATLMQPLEYDILIDGTLIDKDKHDKYMISGYAIKNSKYGKSYRYDDNGSITMIIYTSKS
ncbi:MAG TPA: hypothetical protein VN258_06245 [Mobilitalea sp.]|nr:hypothetical protein [Mobilitalea sp.]